MLVAPPAAGGLARHVIFLADGLSQDGYEVAIACEPDGLIAEAASEREIPLYAVDCATDGGASKTALQSIKLAQAVADFGTQLLHSHSFGASIVGAMASLVARGVGFIATFHNYPPGTATMVPEHVGQRWGLGVVVQRAHRIITVSEALRRDLVTGFPDAMQKCLTIPNGIDTGAAPTRDADEVRRGLRIREEVPLVGVVARFAPQKGIIEFLEAARLIVNAHPSACCVIAGDGPLMQEAEDRRAELGLTEQVEFLGHIDWARELLGALDLLVIPSVSEGSSVVAMEAMALGKPVVATSVGGVPEVVLDGETGLVVAPSDPQGLSKAVGDLLADPDRARTMGERGRVRARAHFDIADMLERTKAVYADVLREHMGEAKT
jgi:glycosyltransferase involved in cell wall biosynthesis